MLGPFEKLFVARDGKKTSRNNIHDDARKKKIIKSNG